MIRQFGLNFWKNILINNLVLDLKTTVCSVQFFSSSQKFKLIPPTIHLN